MTFIYQIKNSLQTNEPNLTRRLFKSAWEPIGHIKREVDTRTKDQLLENIDYFAKKYPEVAQFKESLKKMNPKHLGLVSDICELAAKQEMINTAINIRNTNSNGKSLFEFLLEKLPITSKENPAAIELSQEIINNTDSIGAKYALAAISPLYERKDAAKHIEATIPFVSDIAEATLNGGYQMDYTKEKNFVNALSNFISPNVPLERLTLLKDICKIADKAKASCDINAFQVLKSKTPINVIKENLETFKKIDENMQGKEINLTEFLEKNVNIS